MAIYTRKRSEIIAIQWTGEYYDCDDMPEWLIEADEAGILKINPSDWVILECDGNVSTCEDKDFREQYVKLG